MIRRKNDVLHVVQSNEWTTVRCNTEILHHVECVDGVYVYHSSNVFKVRKHARGTLPLIHSSIIYLEVSKVPSFQHSTVEDGLSVLYSIYIYPSGRRRIQRIGPH